MLNSEDLTALLLSLRLALATSLLLVILVTPMAWWLARNQTKLKSFIEALTALPIVLPPTVIGFYLLICLGPMGPLGIEGVVFSFTGLLVASIIYSLPFVLRPIQDAFSAIDENLLEVAASLGASPWERFKRIVLPLSRYGYFSGFILGFAHTLGEFGVVLMIGGNIPGKTQVVSIAIYDYVESLNYERAHILSGHLLVLSFVALLFISFMKRKNEATK